MTNKFTLHALNCGTSG